MEQSREWSSALPYTCVVAIEKEAFGSPSTKVADFTYLVIFLNRCLLLEILLAISIHYFPDVYSHI